jgi:hypothetical protein
MSQPETTNQETTSSVGRPARGLWASAFILLVLVMIQAQPLLAQGLLGGGHTASAGMVSQAGSVTVMTADAGNDDVLLVLEGRGEELFVYRTSRDGMQIQQRLAVPKLFQDAKAMSGK